jgi:hypothetical protein
MVIFDYIYFFVTFICSLLLFNKSKEAFSHKNLPSLSWLLDNFSLFCLYVHFPPLK